MSLMTEVMRLLYLAKSSPLANLSPPLTNSSQAVREPPKSIRKKRRGESAVNRCAGVNP
jgi:hypothetical protein